MKNIVFGFVLFILPSLAWSAPLNQALTCDSFFTNDVFKELKLSGSHLYSDNSMPILIATGSLYYTLNQKELRLDVTPSPAQNWFQGELSLLGVTSQTYDAVENFPLKGNLTFLHPASSHNKCSCDFYFAASRAPANPVQCQEYLISREDGDIPLRNNFTPKVGARHNPQPEPKKMRDTNIRGKIHK